MATQGSKKDVDMEADMHGLTAEQMRVALQQQWPKWQGKQAVRIIHGQGTVLRPEVERWCREMGIPVSLDPGNPGALKIYPRERHTAETGNTAAFGTSLRDKGLRLTPEQEAELRDPQAMQRAREAEKRRKADEERKRRETEAQRRARQKHDEDLWAMEMARLDKMEQKRSGALPEDVKPTAPRIVPPSVMKVQEGLWRGELVRVADTEENTLIVQKRTGLDKLAPPMAANAEAENKKKEEVRALTPLEKARKRQTQRDTNADQELFEAELERLFDSDAADFRRRT